MPQDGVLPLSQREPPTAPCRAERPTLPRWGWHEVTVEGRALVVERPYSRRPRLLSGQAELPEDRFRNYSLPDDSGERCTVTVGCTRRGDVALSERGELGCPGAASVPSWAT
jgi:hypothetical protein